jgi:hypothetical protein
MDKRMTATGSQDKYSVSVSFLPPPKTEEATRHTGFTRHNKRFVQNHTSLPTVTAVPVVGQTRLCALRTGAWMALRNVLLDVGCEVTFKIDYIGLSREIGGSHASLCFGW